MSDKQLTESEAPSDNETPSVEPHGDPIAEVALDSAPATEDSAPEGESTAAAEGDTPSDPGSEDGGEAEVSAATSSDEPAPADEKASAEAPAAEAAASDGDEGAKDVAEDGAAEDGEAKAVESETPKESSADDSAKGDDSAEAKASEADKATAEAKPAKEEKPAAEAKPADEAKKDKAAASADGEGKDAKGKAAEGENTAEEEEVEDSPEVAALREAKDNKTPVTGKVIGWNRGGFHIALEGFTAFCPNSEMEPGRPKDPASYLDKELTFRVIKVQKRGRRVVLSRAELAREERAEKAAETMSKLQPGAVLKGTVSSVTDFGAFVDLGGIEGLVHVSEISRSRVGHAREAVQVGKEVEVKVLKVEQGGKRISLSMKALEPNPWDGVAERFPRGSEFTGKVVRKTDFGLFVEMEPDVDGLVHLSRLPHGVEMNDESLEVDKEVKGWVQEVEPKRQRISLSLREIPKNDPWQDASEQFPEGDAVEGTVESLAPFGVFINLAPGLTGLLPASEMGLPKNANPGRMYAPGQKVKVQVVSIDRRRKRISLAKEGSAVEGSRNDYQAYVKQQKEAESGGMSAMEAAFAKLKGDR